MPVLRVAYFFSGVPRKASICSYLQKFAEETGYGLEFHEIDIYVGGSEHDLMDSETQEAWISRIVAGEFDVIILSPPCGSWSRANWANNDGPQPCRDRRHPWGLPNMPKHQHPKRLAQALNNSACTDL